MGSVCLFVPIRQLHWLFTSRLRQWEVCVCLFLYVSYTDSVLVNFGSGNCVFVCSCMSVKLALCSSTSAVGIVCLFVLVCQSHWLFASRLRQWEVCVCLFPYVSYTDSVLNDFGSGKCVRVCAFVLVCQLH